MRIVLSVKNKESIIGLFTLKRMVSYKNSINPPKKYGKTAKQSCQL